MSQEEFLNKCLQFDLDNKYTDERYKYLTTEQTASMDLIDYFSLRIIREGSSKSLVLRRRSSYIDYNIVESITIIGLSSVQDPEPVEAVENKSQYKIDLTGYEAIDINVLLGSDNPSLIGVELQEAISCGKSRRSSRVMSRSLLDVY